MTIERTRDYELVKRIITDPVLYDHVSDDGSPKREVYEPTQSDAIYYLLAKDNEELLGCFIVIPLNFVCYEVHTCLLPNSWGARAHQAAIDARKWVFAHSPAERIITNVPENNSLALRFAKLAGLQEFGRNRNSWKKNGRLYDLILLGASKCQ